jgi:colanic acid/amylovoran biosynthesis glycosyltransferase
VYVQLSQAFIRRAIAALKNVGLKIDRYRLRCWDQPLVDEAGKVEQHRTHVVLGVGGMGLLLATLRTLLTRAAAR